MKAWIITVFCVTGVLHLVQGQVANDDFYTAAAGAAFNVSAPGVLTNDTGEGLTAMLVSGPTNGTLTLNADGSFSYTPTNNFTGVDGFTYKAISGSVTPSVATVVISVVAPGELFYDNFARPANSSAIFPWVPATGINPNIVGSWGITNNLLIGVSTDTNYGLVYYPNSNWTNYSVQAQIRFSADNAASASIFGRLNTSSGEHYGAWIYPEESPEFLASGNGTAVLWLIKYDTWTYPYTLMGSKVTLPGVGVNWHNLKMTFQGNTISAYFDGQLVESVTDDGSIDSSPVSSSGGIGMNLWTLPQAAYVFSVDDVIVSATSNSIANYDSYNAVSNTTLRVAAPGVLANDTGNGSLTAIEVSGPADGSLILTNNGGFSYTPATNYVGIDSFTYECTDGQTTSSVATVNITVNHSPVAYDDAYSMKINAALSVGRPGVLAKDQGGDKPLTALLATGPAVGRLSLAKNGSFSYRPKSRFTGTDSFTYVATDGQTTSGVATVTIAVIPAPTANNDFYTVEPGAVLNVPAPGVLLNDANLNGSLTVLLESHPAHGTLSWGGDGSFRYQATTNYTGMDTFTYKIINSYGASGVATVDIMVMPTDELFYDNFTRPADSDILFPWVREAGTWRITRKTLIGTSPTNSYGYAYYENTNWTDYSVQARIRFSSTKGWGGAIGGRLNPATGARYDVWVYPENSPEGPDNGAPAGVATLQINKYETWTGYTAENLVTLPGVGTDWHTVELAFSSNNIFAYFDSNLVTTVTDDGSIDGNPAYTNGGISLSLWTQTPPTYTFSVSNVVVVPSVVNDSYSMNENTKGGITYKPAANFTGTDGFTRHQSGTTVVTRAAVPAVAPAPAPVILSIGLTNEVVSITWSSVTGQTYQVQSVDDLRSAHWNNASPGLTATGSTATQTNFLGNGSQRFYRVLLMTP
jgi:hypothetical protein